MKNCVWCVGAMRTFGEVVSKALGWPLFVEAMIPPCDTVLIIGMYDVPDYDYTLQQTEQACSRVIYFCGTDVMALSRPDLLPAAKYMCETTGIQNELAQFGIEASVVTFPTPHHFEATPFPEPAIAFYQGNNSRKYGESIVRVVAQTFPEVDIIAYGYGNHTQRELQEVVDRTTMMLRLPDHDGAAASAREFMEAGRYVVCTTDLPYARKVRRSDPVGIIKAVRDTLKKSEMDTEARDFYKQFNSDERFVREFEAAIA